MSIPVIFKFKIQFIPWSVLNGGEADGVGLNSTAIGVTINSSDAVHKDNVGVKSECAIVVIKVFSGIVTGMIS
jgi:hypothetical protein